MGTLIVTVAKMNVVINFGGAIFNFGYPNTKVNKHFSHY